MWTVFYGQGQSLSRARRRGTGGFVEARPDPVRSATELDSGLFGAVRRIVHRHALQTDALLAAVLLAVSTLWLALSPFGGVKPALVQTTLIVPLVWRRSHPTVVFMALSAVALGQWLAGYRLLGDVAVLVALYTVAVHETRRRALTATVILEVGAALAATRWIPAGTAPRSFIFLSATVVAALCAGWTVRSGSEYMEWLAERAERLEIERDQQKAIGAAVERNRIAREVHDIVAHSLSVVITLADAASVVNATDPDRATEAMRHTSEVGRQALSDMRTVINVLRTEDHGALLGPQPTIAQLDDLFARVRATGLEVKVETKGSPVGLGAATELTVYRILQEALTNTIKHAAATTAFVVLRYGHPQIELSVTDNGSGKPVADHDGHGIEGMIERASLHGGTLEAGPGADGGWSVSAV
jgi:signal transduction histidine kinase